MELKRSTCMTKNVKILVQQPISPYQHIQSFVMYLFRATGCACPLEISTKLSTFMAGNSNEYNAHIPRYPKTRTSEKDHVKTLTLRTHIKFNNIDTQASSNTHLHLTQKREAQSTIDTTNAKRQRQSTMKESFQFSVHHSPIPTTIHLSFQIPQQDQATMKENHLQITPVTPKNITRSVVVNRSPTQNFSSRYDLRKRKKITYTEWNEQVEMDGKRKKKKQNHDADFLHDVDSDVSINSRK